MKKTLSLLMAIVMLMSVLIIPAAAAAPDDTIAPCSDFYECPRCYTMGYLRNVLENNSVSTVTVSSCSNYNHPHSHYKYYDQYIIDCYYCGTIVQNVLTKTVCPY